MSDTTAFNFSDRRSGDGDRRALQPLGNGKGEWVRWALNLIIPAMVAAVLAWVAVSNRISVIEEREQNHYQELLRQFQALREDIRAIGRDK